MTRATGSGVPSRIIRSSSAGVFKILTDPTRRCMLNAMHAGGRSVGERVAAVDIERPGVSRHLRIMPEAGLVAMLQATM